MGQYYRACSIDTLESITPHAYDNGAKLMEHSYVGNNFVKAIEQILSPNGAWYKHHLCWAGDYMDTGLFMPIVKADGSVYESDDNLYSITIENEIKPVKLPKKGRYLVNHTKKVYIDMSEYEVGYIHPLPLLTCSGNGRGGGDYEGSFQYTIVGSWAGDSISFEHSPMYDKIDSKKIEFREDRT